MSVAAGSDSSHHSGDDSDNEGSVACSDKSDMIMSDISRKRPRKTPQCFGNAWVFRGIITTEKALLHTDSDQGAADDPFPKVAALLKAHWEGPCRGQDPITAKPIKNFGFFCNLTSLLARTPDFGDPTKVNVEIRAFLQSKKMARTGLNKMLPTKHEFLSGDWESWIWDRCVGGLSGHVWFEACMQAIGVWMPLLQIGSGFRPNNHARKNEKAAKKVCCYHQFKIS